MEKEVWTPIKLIKWTTEYFKKHGVDEARLDAEILLAHTLKIERIMLYAGFERVLTDEELTRFRESVKERAAGRPAKYIIGRTEFYSLPLAVDERVLVPRPETEILVARAIELVQKAPAEPRPVVVEIGTGSGAIAIAVASNAQGPRYIATDISAKALEVARANAAANGVGDRIEFLEGDLFEALSALGVEGEVCLLLSNPPYVKSGDVASLPREIREHEPRGALTAGPAGTEVHERILEGARRLLKPGGIILMEMDNDQKGELEQIAARFDEYEAPAFHQDYSHLWRVIEVRKTL